MNPVIYDWVKEGDFSPPDWVNEQERSEPHKHSLGLAFYSQLVAMGYSGYTLISIGRHLEDLDTAENG